MARLSRPATSSPPLRPPPDPSAMPAESSRISNSPTVAARSVSPSSGRSQPVPSSAQEPEPTTGTPVYARILSSQSLPAVPAMPAPHARIALLALTSFPTPAIPASIRPPIPPSPTPAPVTSQSSPPTNHLTPPPSSRRLQPGPSAMINPSATCHPRPRPHPERTSPAASVIPRAAQRSRGISPSIHAPSPTSAPR